MDIQWSGCKPHQRNAEPEIRLIIGRTQRESGGSKSIWDEVQTYPVFSKLTTRKRPPGRPGRFLFLLFVPQGCTKPRLRLRRKRECPPGPFRALRACRVGPRPCIPAVTNAGQTPSNHLGWICHRSRRSASHGFACRIASPSVPGRPQPLWNLLTSAPD